MFSITVGCGDLSDSYLKRITQLGVDCVDFGSGDFFPGVKNRATRIWTNCSRSKRRSIRGGCGSIV